MYQIYKEGKSISKKYPANSQALIECYELGYVNNAGSRRYLLPNVEIKEIEE